MKVNSARSLFSPAKRWKDVRLSWNPVVYRNITVLGTRKSNIWAPQVNIFDEDNTGEELGGDHDESVGGKVRYDGRVECRSVLLRAGSCIGGYRQWPYDQHNCMVQLGYEADEGQGMGWEPYHRRITFPRNSRGKMWKVAAYTVFQASSVLNSDGRNYSMMVCTFMIDRNSQLYLATFISLGLGTAYVIISV